MYLIFGKIMKMHWVLKLSESAPSDCRSHNPCTTNLVEKWEGFGWGFFSQFSVVFRIGSELYESTVDGEVHRTFGWRKKLLFFKLLF